MQLVCLMSQRVDKSKMSKYRNRLEVFDVEQKMIGFTSEHGCLINYCPEGKRVMRKLILQGKESEFDKKCCVAVSGKRCSWWNRCRG